MYVSHLIPLLLLFQGRQLLEREFNNIIAMGTDRRLGEEVSMFTNKKPNIQIWTPKCYIKVNEHEEPALTVIRGPIAPEKPGKNDSNFSSLGNLKF